MTYLTLGCGPFYYLIKKIRERTAQQKNIIKLFQRSSIKHMTKEATKQPSVKSFLLAWISTLASMPRYDRELFIATEGQTVDNPASGECLVYRQEQHRRY